MQNKNTIQRVSYYIISCFQVWPELVGTNVVHILVLGCIKPQNSYSRFISSRIISFVLDICSIKKNSAKQKPQERVTYIIKEELITL